MRIAYVSLHWPRTTTSGVGKKIQQQMSLWREAGCETRFFMHMHPCTDPSTLLDGQVSMYQVGRGILGRLITEWNRSKALKEIMADIRMYQPDIIYLRSGMYTYPLERLSIIAPVVSEINTNDIVQHGQLGWVTSTYNRLTRGILLRSVQGLVCVSGELAKGQEFAVFGKPTRTIANSIDLAAYKPLGAPRNDRPRLVFIGSPDNSWHGVDKLITFGKAYPDLQIDVIGYDKDKYEGLPENIHLHGYLRSADYTGVLAKADAALGSLALHRAGIREGSPLKTRECLAYGLPLVLPFLDTDLDDLDCNFLLKIPNTDDNMVTHGTAVRDFAYRMSGVRVDREVIAPRIDARLKEKERLSFFAEIISKGKPRLTGSLKP